MATVIASFSNLCMCLADIDPLAGRCLNHCARTTGARYRSFLKKMLDEQIDLNDLKDMDAALHKGLMTYLAHPLASLGMDDMTFTTEVHYFGETKVEELKPGGAALAVRFRRRSRLLIFFVASRSRCAYVERGSSVYHVCELIRVRILRPRSVRTAAESMASLCTCATRQSARVPTRMPS